MDRAQTPVKFDIYAGGQLARTEILTEQTIKIGRLSSSHLRLDDESVSRMHAVIEVSGPDSVMILDLGSATGTLVNGERITKQALRTGDRLQIGDVHIIVAIAGQRSNKAPERKGKGGRPIVRNAPLFDDEDDVPGASRTLEILTLWGQTVVNVQHLSKPGVFTIGDADNASQFVPAGMVPEDPYPVAEFDGVSMIVNVPEGISGEIMLNGEVHSLDDLKAAGKVSRSASPRSVALKLPPKARCRLSFGEMTLLINSVASAPALPPPSPFSILEAQQVFFLGLAALLHGLYFAIVLSMPEGMDSLGMDAFDMSDRFVEFILKPEDELQEKRNMQNLFDDLEEEAEAAAKAKGDEGKMGKQDSTERNNHFAVKGEASNAEIQLAKARARQEALDTASAAFNSLEGELSAVWGKGDRAIGSDAMSAMGNMFGDRAGESHGFGGLGVAGGGMGGGGFGENSIGVGNVGTAGRGGRGGNGNSYGRGVSRLGERTAKVPKVIPGKPEIRGSLDKETIRRIIRRHRNEYRYCYEKELNVKRDLEGKIVVKFTISGTGSVIAASIAETTMRNANVESCLTKKIQRWAFPAPKGGGIVTVRYPFIFKAN
ncbi:TonB family protein [Myxococcota bacterium]|nr:TonB family protein [Myxococcota bacterium]MBU1432136.1 TonB family protein [Myxococcota bacterium]MBU1898635.1 TonB family protein [Myxococcota bacterium]